jgi:hypothetical protein
LRGSALHPVNRHIINRRSACRTAVFLLYFGKASHVKTLLLLLLPLFAQAGSTPPQKEYYSILVYHLKDAAQETRMDTYLKDALIPAAHKSGIVRVGVFKPIDNDTSADRRVYVLLTGRSAEQLLKLPQALQANNAYLTAGKDYINAAWDQPVYTRMENIVLEAFQGTQQQLPPFTAPRGERIYELRNYESASEKLHQSKVDMFIKGDEIGIFKRLGFNAVFYADVLSGSRMPNFMYMTSFESRNSREGHWKDFGNDAAWKKLLADPQYAHNTSRTEVILLHPTDYSDF